MIIFIRPSQIFIQLEELHTEAFDHGIRVLKKMMALEPEVFVPSHGVPIVGAENVKTILSTYRDAIKYVHDQTMRNINNGLSPLDSARAVRLPDLLKVTHTYLNSMVLLNGVLEIYSTDILVGLMVIQLTFS